ncbi:hypothetical protein [Sphingomonas corticis]|uniref:Uncharacterized protein n=1 Tax=Sphingomonas corticis TaxID=2722791 RepID=A0ABX1CQ32_9SPHN|nr:hypothetical protein [Sphingomonas corticis]NJR80055.1 hypothetical protein [Sphingomonas corticis]
MLEEVEPPPGPAGLDVRRFRLRPHLHDLTATPAQRREAWASFRSVRIAVGVLAYYSLKVNSRSVERMTELLEGKVEHVIRVSGKTVLENEMCRCVVDAFSTTVQPRRSARRSKFAIPRSWLKLSRLQTREIAAEYKEKYERAERGRLEAIRMLRDRSSASDPLTEKLARLAAMAASLGPDAGMPEQG